MASKLVTAAAVALALVCPASAETRISVGRTPAETQTTALATLGTVTGGTVKGVALDTGEAGTATLRFDVTTTSARPIEVLALLDVVRGARVTDMRITVGGRPLYTRMLDPRGALRAYHGIVEAKADPALLERVGSTETGAELRLRVFPLTRRASAHVELTIEAPHAHDGYELAVPGYVSGETSLVALEQPLVAPPVVHLGCGYYHHGDLDKAIIRRYMKRNLPRVKACYERELLRHHELAGGVELHFSIGSDGKTHDVSVDGDLPSDAVRSCIADDVARWEFPAVEDGYSAIRVNYPLTLVPSGG